MIFPTILAALAALPAISAQSTSVSAETATRCTTQFGFNPLPTGSEGVPTWYTTTTTTSLFSQEITTQDTFTVTPSATTFTDVETTTTVLTTTDTTTPAASTQPTPSGFLPLLVIDPASPTPFPTPTGSSRVMRAIEARGGLKNSFKRQSETAPGNVGGFMAYPNGSYSGINRHHPHRVDCRVLVTEFDTVITTVTGTPETVTAPQSTATATSTETVSSTTTIIEVAPTPTIYQACQGNNVVDHITDVNGNTLRFDRFVFRADQGYPLANQVGVNTTSATNCCIACQNTPFCAGSAYAPGVSVCQLFLTQPPTPYPGNDTATATTSAIPEPTGTSDNSTCSDGSLSNFMGTISGLPDFPEQYAVAFSNGPCGRFAVNPVSAPIESPGPVKRGLIAAM